MKFFCTRFFAVFLFLFFAFNAKAANDTLTIGQAFDWSVGDTFIYKSYYRLYQTYNGNPLGPPNITDGLVQVVVLSRLDLVDSVFYSFLLNNYTTPVNLKIGNIQGDVTKLPALYPIFGMCVSDFDTNYTYHNRYLDFNGLTTDSFSCICYTTVAFTEKVGIKNYHHSWGYGYNGGYRDDLICTINLIYYKSASTGFIYSDVAEPPTVKPTFEIFPNPASDEITITAETENHVPFDAYIYDISGKCLLTHKNISNTLGNLKVSSLQPGYYFLKLTDHKGLSASKGFIIVR